MAKNNVNISTDANSITVTTPTPSQVLVERPAATTVTISNVGIQGPPGANGADGLDGAGGADLANLNAFTGSINTFTGSIQTEVDTLTAATSSYLTNSLSSSIFIYSGSFSGSFEGDGSNLTGIVTDLTPLNTFTGSIQTEVDNLTAATSSYLTEVPSGTVSGSAQITAFGFISESVDTSAFATTGSNNFIGNQVITGSLTISGSSTFTNIGPAVFTGSFGQLILSGSEFKVQQQVFTTVGTDLSSSANFEADLGNWVNDPSNAVDWTRDSGGTPTSNTGPSSAVSGSFYIYVEGNSNSTGQLSILEHPYTSSAVDFYYYAYGFNIGTLAYETFNEGTWTEQFSVTGDQGEQWIFQRVNHSPADKTRFKYTAGGSFAEDIALDLINVYNATEVSESRSIVLNYTDGVSNINAQQVSATSITATSANFDIITTTDGSRIISKVFNDNLSVLDGLSDLNNLTTWGTDNLIVGGPRDEAGTDLQNNNTYVGSNAGRYFNSPSNVTAVGAQALYRIVSTQHASNTAVGAQAGYGMRGNYSTIVGANALYTIGSANVNKGAEGVFIGYRSGYRPVEVSTNDVLGKNVAVGYQTMNLSYLSSSIAIGYESNYSADTAEERRGSLVTLLGPYTNVSQSVNIINATGIGANVEVKQSNTVILGNNADVGIGTTTPTAKLEVSGSSKFIGDQVITGSLDLQADNDYKIDGQRVIHKVSGSYILLNDNVDLFNFNTTSLNEGNIIIGGATSGDAESYSRSNVIIGANAHQNLPSSEYSTVIGASAGSMPTGYTQVFNTTLVGAFASKNVGASYCTFIGAFAGWSLSTGFNNTADFSVYVGRSAGSRPQVAGGMHNNVAVGSSAMERAYLSSSVALGYYAGRSSSDGEERRGSLVTLLGPYTNVSQSVNIINATAIGANVEVEQSNTVILGNNADVGIGTTTPTAKLEVSGSVVISDILTLEPTHPAPASAPSGSIISSGSGAELKPYFWNGSTWTSMI